MDHGKPCKPLSRRRTAKWLAIATARVYDTYEWDSGKIPKNNHETPFFMIHIPGLRYAFLALGAKIRSTSASYDQNPHGVPGIHIESSGKTHKEHILSKLIKSDC